MMKHTIHQGWQCSFSAIFLLFLLGFGTQSFAQSIQESSFREMVQKRQSYFDRLKADGHDLKGVGYKSFKRWEYFWGKRMPPDMKFSEVYRYLGEQEQIPAIHQIWRM